MPGILGHSHASHANIFSGDMALNLRRKKQECNECPDSVDSTTSLSNQSSDESLWIIKGSELAIKEIAKYVKQLNGFKNICLEDQESLLKIIKFMK
ncbi:unnamed protein product [Oppiella nova]|uniref:Uncharacterized protein n=1 Tax=Oppiella nova TaxID=334625 RepID=A0A7R9LG80_9ACAR|nr:unnamed protein product [Oppiella nova]CAG2163360.1 unnamed protein product [Oppiella nova]